jgi:hypothetical protein
MSRTTSARVGDGNTATGAPRPAPGPSRTSPDNVPPSSLHSWRKTPSTNCGWSCTAMFQRCSSQLCGKTPVSTRRVVGPWLKTSARSFSFQSPQPLPLPSVILLTMSRLPAPAPWRPAVCFAAIGNQLQRDGLEVQQQRIRGDVVGTHRLGVETPRVGTGRQMRCGPAPGRRGSRGCRAPGSGAAGARTGRRSAWGRRRHAGAGRRQSTPSASAPVAKASVFQT